MKNRYRLYRRKLGGVFYIHDSETGKQETFVEKLDSKAQLVAIEIKRSRNVGHPEYRSDVG